MLQRLNDCYLIPGQYGIVGHGSRERDGRAWMPESSCGPGRVPWSMLGDGRRVATRPANCSSRLSRALVSAPCGEQFSVDN